MPDKWEKRDHTRGRKQDLGQKSSGGEVKGLREKCLGEKRESLCREKSKRNEKEIAMKLYKETDHTAKINPNQSVPTLIPVDRQRMYWPLMVN